MEKMIMFSEEDYNKLLAASSAIEIDLHLLMDGINNANIVKSGVKDMQKNSKIIYSILRKE